MRINAQLTTRFKIVISHPTIISALSQMVVDHGVEIERINLEQRLLFFDALKYLKLDHVAVFVAQHGLGNIECGILLPQNTHGERPRHLCNLTLITLKGHLLVVERDKLADDLELIILIYGLLAVDVCFHDRELHRQVILKLIHSERITLLSHSRIRLFNVQHVFYLDINF